MATTAIVATIVEERPAPVTASRSRLVLLSFLMLFVELALIRWTGSNIVYLSYFSNFVLLGSFLGIGIGFLRARARVNLFPWAPVALAFFVVFVRLFPVEIDRSGSGLIFFGSFHRSGLPIWVTLPVVFVAVATVMAMIAEGVAGTFVRFEPLEAYRLDIMGSLGGVVAFSALSFVGAPPVGWGLVVAAAFVTLLGRPMTVLQVAGILILLAVLWRESVTRGDSWSPYYKVSVRPGPSGTVGVSVNGIPHQEIEPLDLLRDSAYAFPYERARPGLPGDVLVVGAGTGNDVALALAEGAQHVDAVEIDPRLYGIGKAQNPARPYDDPRVRVFVDDGRAFLQRSDRRYDFILFALPDSLTLVSGQSSLRLESYLFTIEAMREARDHLKAGGVFAMYNLYRERWLVDRLANTLRAVYGRAPCLDTAGRTGYLAVLVTSADPGAVRCGTVWASQTHPVPAPATDDHPFPYLKTPGIPGFYGITIAMILLASLVIVRLVGGPLGPMTGYLDLFFMGAAFLLLETKNVVQFALLFGTTWLVNALVFAGILVAVLAAVEVSRRFHVGRPSLLYAMLLAALALAWIVPASALLSLSPLVRFGTATLLAFTPIFLANLVFAQRFKDVSSSSIAFATNLLGAMTGGILEYGSLVVGYRALLIVVAALYGLAFAFGRRHLARA